MIKYLINEYKRIKYNMPFIINKEWFAKVVHSKDFEYPPAFNKKGDFIDYKKGMRTPMFKTKDGWYVYYTIIRIHYRTGDWVYDSDGYKYDLKFHHFSKKFKFPIEL